MKTKSLTEGAMICALSIILSLLCYYVPFMILLYIFIPVPIIILSQRQGTLVALIASIGATALLFIFIDFITAITFGAFLILTGCGLGYVYNKGKGGFLKLVVGYVCIFLTLVLMIAMMQVVTGQNFVESLVMEFSTAGDSAIALYQNTGLLSADQLAQMEELVKTMMTSVKMLIPTVFLVTPFFIVWANVVVADKIIGRIKVGGDKVNIPLKPLSQWALPKSLKVFLLVVLSFVMIVNLTGTTAIPTIYVFTLLEICFIIFAVMGLSFLFWIIGRKRKKESMGLKIGIVVLCTLFSFGMYFLSMLGVADTYLNIRSAIKMKDEMK